MLTRIRFNRAQRVGRQSQVAFTATFLLASLAAVTVYWLDFHRRATAQAVAMTVADFDSDLSDDTERVRNDFSQAFNAVRAIASVTGMAASTSDGAGAGLERIAAVAARNQVVDDMPTRAIYLVTPDPAGVDGARVAQLSGDPGAIAADPAVLAVVRRHARRLRQGMDVARLGLSSAVHTPIGDGVICSAAYAGPAGARAGGVVAALFPAEALRRDLDPSYFALAHPGDGDDGVIAAPGAAAAIGPAWAGVCRGEAPVLSASATSGYSWAHANAIPGSDEHPWRLVGAVPAAAFYATPDFDPVRSQGRTILIGGTAVSLLLAGLVWALTTGRARAMAVARSMVQDLVRATAAAESATRAKSEFLAHMSHEIRTPLNGVAGMFDLLRGTELTPLQARYARVGRDAADALLNVINDILDFSKIEAGKVEIEAIEFDLGQLVGSLLELLDPIATKKGLRLACELPAGLPRRSLGDPTRVRQVLTNLVSNAIKFTAAGSVTVRASVEPATPGDADAAEAGTVVRLEVSDTGMGIPADRLHRLFESFSQVDASTNRQFGGTGLGLAISKRLAGLMGGQIGVDSEPGRGTTFWFTVRLGHAAAPATTVQPALGEGDPLVGLHLLVADDNEINRFLAGELLRRAGHTFDLVEDGAAAVAAAAAGGYDAILMDCQMPNVDGLEATRQIRHREASGPASRVPILALTAEAIDGDRERCLAAGMDGYVTKPINLPRLLAALRSAVADRPRSAPLGRAA